MNLVVLFLVSCQNFRYTLILEPPLFSFDYTSKIVYVTSKLIKPTFQHFFQGYDVIHSPKEEKPVINFTEPAPASSTSTNTTSSKLCGPTLSDLFNPAKRKLPTITIESLDELTASTNAGKRFRSSAASSSTASSVCGDNGSEASASTKPTKRRGRPPKPVASVRDRSEYEHLSEADMRYREQRDKNNEASRKSRINRKDRESKLEEEASELIEKYEVLEGKERELIRECARWRKAVMRLALL